MNFLWNWSQMSVAEPNWWYKSTLVQVMAWCRQATSHYLSQCWPTNMSPCGHRELTKDDLCYQPTYLIVPITWIHIKPQRKLPITKHNSRSWISGLTILSIKFHNSTLVIYGNSGSGYSSLICQNWRINLYKQKILPMPRKSQQSNIDSSSGFKLSITLIHVLKERV